MEVLLNRWRGTGVIFTSIPLLTGTRIYALYLGLLIGYFSTYYYGVLAIALFLAGESFAWGKWVGSLCHPENITDEVKNSKCGKSFPYIHYIANSIVNQDDEYEVYCEVALAIRGFIWWTPLLVLLGAIDLIPLYLVVINSIILAVGFPIACYVGRNINFECNYKYFHTSKGWCNQELVYGIIQFVCITLTIGLSNV